MGYEDDDKFERVGVVFLCLIILVSILLIPIAIYDMGYIIPAAADKANVECQLRGYDFYESYERIGILSKEPVAITCKYVEQYREIDLNIDSRTITK